MKKYLLIITGLFLLHLVFIYVISFFHIPKGSFPHESLLQEFGINAYINAFAHFDGVHYLRISLWGYVNYEQVFFPLLPLGITIINLFTQNVLAAGLLVTNICLLGAFFLLEKLSKLLGIKHQWTVIFFVSFPTAFFFHSVYTESLFLFFIVGFFLFLFSKKYFFAMFFSFFAALTRVQGIFLLIPIFIWIYKEGQISNMKKVLLILSPVFGLGLYMLFLNIQFKDPLLFYHAQEKFGANRTSSSIIFLPQVLYRYFKILITFDYSVPYFVALMELGIFLFVFIVLIWDLYMLSLKKMDIKRIGINLFSVVNILVPTLTGTLSSVPRYSLMSLSFFFFLSAINSLRIKVFLVIIFLIFHLAMFVLFVHGYFIS